MHKYIPAWSKRTWTIVAISSLFALGALGYVGFRAYQPASPIPITPVRVEPAPAPEPPKPTTKASPLTGLQLEPAIADRPIRAIVIENHPDARPQSGLGEAGVVYEALAEGGITRFLAFFLESQPAQLGPVRSLRPYFIDWAKEYAAPIAHAGGSAEAIGLVAPTGTKSLNALSGAYSGSFMRTRDRYAPHNLYTSTQLMDALLGRLGYAVPATFTPNTRQVDAPLAAPDRPKLIINYSYSGYVVEYRYDAPSNSYARFLAGAPHVDRNLGKQIMVKNVVVLMTNTTYQSSGHAVMGTIGQGSAIIFRDGTAIAGTWNKPSREARTQLLDAAGKEIPLNIGNTWYSVVPVGRPVTY